MTHGPHHELDPKDPKPPGEVVTPPAATPGEDVNIGVIVRFAVGLLAGVALVSALVLALMNTLERRATATDPKGPLPPGSPRAQDAEYGRDLTRPDGSIRLQRQPFADMEALREAEAKQLVDYGWVDAKAGVVHIPIEDAMRLLAQRGLPTRTALSEAVVPPAAVTTPTPVPATPRPTRRPAPRTPTPAGTATSAEPAATTAPAASEGAP